MEKRRMTPSSSFFPSVIRRIHIHVSMQGYIRNAIIVIMIGITASCDSVIISAYDAVALNRNICANSTPLSTACHKTISYIFTTTEVIRIRGIAFQWCVPPLALFAGIIFHIHVSLSPLESRPSSA